MQQNDRICHIKETSMNISEEHCRLCQQCGLFVMMSPTGFTVNINPVLVVPFQCCGINRNKGVQTVNILRPLVHLVIGEVHWGDGGLNWLEFITTGGTWTPLEYKKYTDKPHMNENKVQYKWGSSVYPTVFVSCTNWVHMIIRVRLFVVSMCFLRNVALTVMMLNSWHCLLLTTSSKSLTRFPLSFYHSFFSWIEICDVGLFSLQCVVLILLRCFLHGLGDVGSVPLRWAWNVLFPTGGWAFPDYFRGPLHPLYLHLVLVLPVWAVVEGHVSARNTLPLEVASVQGLLQQKIKAPAPWSIIQVFMQGVLVLLLQLFMVYRTKQVALDWTVTQRA